MSIQFTRADGYPVGTPSPPDPSDPFAGIPGKIGDMLRNGDAVNNALRRELAGKHLLDDADEYEGSSVAGDPYNWQEPPKTKGFDLWSWDSGVAGKPKDPRLKKEDDAVPPRTLGEHLAAEDRANAFKSNPKPYDNAAYYDKNKGHLDLGPATDWVNQNAFDTKQRERQRTHSDGADPTDGGSTGLLKNRIADPTVKRNGLSPGAHYGTFSPDLKDDSFSAGEVERRSWHAGMEDVDRLNGGAGYSQTNLGLWSLREHNKHGDTADAGLGARGEIANVFQTGAGETVVRANGLAGIEGSAGVKAKFKPYNTNVAIGAELRGGLFGEAGVTYRPVRFEPTIAGARIDLSPEIGATGRVFTGGEIGGGFKATWRMLPDPLTGKMSPEVGVEAKGAAFVGGKAEIDGSVGAAGIGSVGGNASGLYGLGAEGKARFGIAKDDQGRRKLRFELKFAAALGLGLGFGIRGEINIDGLMRFGAGLVQANKQIARAIINFARAAGNKVSETWKSIIKGAGQGLGEAGHAVKSVAKRAGKAIEGAAKDVGNRIKKAASTVGGAIKNAANTVVETAKNVAKDVGNAFKSVGNKIKDFFGF